MWHCMHFYGVPVIWHGTLPPDFVERLQTDLLLFAVASYMWATTDAYDPSTGEEGVVSFGRPVRRLLISALPDTPIGRLLMAW